MNVEEAESVTHDESNNSLVETTPKLSRKRGRFPETWKCNIAKKSR